MDLQEYCKTLSKERLLNTTIKICEKTLPIWDNYSLTNKLEYIDTVVGLLHNVKKELLFNSIQFAKRKDFGTKVWKKDYSDLTEGFVDPISAIQDMDWELPSDVKNGFYAIYNLITGIKEPMTLFKEQTHYVSINQAIQALESSNLMSTNQIKDILYH